jgi:hypothetical protein
MKRIDSPKDGGRSAPTPNPRERAERLFVGRVRQALDESTTTLSQATLARLGLARKAALRAQRIPAMRLSPAAEFAPSGLMPGRSSGLAPRLGLGRASLVGSAILLVAACLTGLYQFEQDRRIEELADVDTAVLNDDLPISAYADHGFNAFIKQNP